MSLPCKRLRVVFTGVVLCLGLQAAHADKLDEDLQTVWESLWDQRGTPRQVVRWERPIAYRIFGHEADHHAAHIRAALTAAADVVHRQIQDVSAQPDAGSTAMLHLEVVKDSALADNQPCVTSPQKWANGAFDKVHVFMRADNTWRCAFHEVMHAMGIPGHPSGKTVLSYFPYRRDVLMSLDQLMLTAWYSADMPRSATPLEALAVMSGLVARQSDLGLTLEEAQGRAKLFNEHQLKDMEALASGQGEVPAIVRRSGKASEEFIGKARPAMAYFVGLAYLRGVITPKNTAAATPWFQQGAVKGHSGAQVLLARALIQGNGVVADPAAAHGWLTLASRGGNPVATAELEKLEKTLTPDLLAQTRAQPLPTVTPP